MSDLIAKLEAAKTVMPACVSHRLRDEALDEAIAIVRGHFAGGGNMVGSLRRALVLAAIPLEAIRAGGTDKSHCPEVREAIETGVLAIRAALAESSEEPRSPSLTDAVDALAWLTASGGEDETDAASETPADDGLRDDLGQLIRVALTNPADLRGFIAANYPKEFANHMAAAAPAGVRSGPYPDDAGQPCPQPPTHQPDGWSVQQRADNLLAKMASEITPVPTIEVVNRHRADFGLPPLPLTTPRFSELQPSPADDRGENAEKCREAFELWHLRIFDQHLPSLREQYGYPKDSIVQTRWQAWQSAWEARASERELLALWRHREDRGTMEMYPALAGKRVSMPLLFETVDTHAGSESRHLRLGYFDESRSLFFESGHPEQGYWGTVKGWYQFPLPSSGDNRRRG